MVDAVEALRQRWEAVLGRRDVLEAEAEGRVRRWIWTTPNSVRWRFQPFYGERTGERAGRILDAVPERLEEVDAYGYDEDTRLVLARLYRRPAGAYDVVVVEHDGPRSWTAFFNQKGQPIRVGLIERDDSGRLAAVTEYQEEWGDATWWQERYVCADGRLSEIHKRHDEEGAPDQERARWAAGERELLEFDEHGTLTAIRNESPGLESTYVYRRLEFRRSAAAALRDLERALPGAVEFALARVPGLRPFALALQYDAEFPVPPALVVGTRDDCAALRERDPDHDYWLNPAEWRGELPLALEPFGVEPAVVAATIGREEAEDQARSALNRAARRLNRSPPQRFADDPPVVFAVDINLEHLEENLRAALPAARRRELGVE